MRFPRPFKYARRRAKLTTKKGSSVVGDSERRAVRNVFQQVYMLNVVPGRRIELAHSLEDVLDDVGSWTGLENALQVVIAPVIKDLVLEPCQI